MDYIRKEYNSTILPHFHKHLKLYRVKIYPVCQRGKQKKVTLPWEIVRSKDRTKFHMQVFGNKEGIDSLTVAEFDWQGQHCFAYIKHELMIVFSGHALRRYEERVFEIKTNYCLEFLFLQRPKTRKTAKILLKSFSFRNFCVFLPSKWRTEV